MSIRLSDIEVLPRREREKLLRREEMLTAARTIFAQKGYRETTLEDVAELAEFGKGTLYNYFPNKDALFSSVLEETILGFKTIFDTVLVSDLPFNEKLRLLIEESLRCAFSNPEGIMLMTREAQHLRDNNPLMQIKQELVRMLAVTIAAEQKSNPTMFQADADQLALILMNMVMGQFMNRLHLRIFNDALDTDSGGIPCSQITTEMINALTDPEYLEADVQNATDLVYSLYFYGIVGTP